MKCPRCQVSLSTSTYEGKEVWLCEQCKGVLIHQKDLVPILTSLGSALAETIPLDSQIEEVPDKGGVLNCPQCRMTMDQHGYLNSKKVTIDNCSRCWLLWVDPLEFGVMALLYARSIKQAGQEIATLSKNRSDMVSARLLAQSVQRSFFVGPR